MNRDTSILKNSNIVNISVACVIEKNGKFLLIEEKNGWNFPSGKVNYRESPISAIKRETIEESGVNAEVDGLISMYYYKTRKNSYDKKKDRLTFRVNFSGKYISENASDNFREHPVQSWLSKREISKLIEEKKFRNWIAESLAKDALSNKKYPADILFIK